MPAATMVAAWISALIGVGPGIASGSQVCSGNCADLPTTPHSTSSIATVACVVLRSPEAAAPVAAELWNDSTANPNVTIPNSRPMSPSRVITNAFTAPARASWRSQWWPIRKYEQAPMTSQPTSSTNQSSATTTVVMAAVNSRTRKAYVG